MAFVAENQPCFEGSERLMVPTFMAPRLQFGHFEIETDENGSPLKLGAGGMGTTYKARDVNLKRSAVVKVINPELLHDPTIRKRFFNEARAAARIDHPNVAKVLYCSPEGGEGDCFFAMEFVKGESLHSRLKRTGPMQPSLALSLLRGVAEAFIALEEEKLIHRDVKPQNLMIEERRTGERVKLIDFGLVKGVEDDPDLHQCTQVQGFLGSLAFASPEQIGLEPRMELDIRTDFYSLGVTLWYSLCGRPPFTGSQFAIMSAHAYQEPPWEVLSCSDDVKALLRRLLAKQPDERPATAAILLEEWDQAMQGSEAPLVRTETSQANPGTSALPSAATPPKTSGGRTLNATVQSRAEWIQEPDRVYTLAPDVALTLRAVRPGRFQMGSPASERERGANEDPVEVEMSPYWLGTMQVTQAQWGAVMPSNPSYFKGPDLPVESISWHAAAAFIKVLARRFPLERGWEWALPTEAQWEYACRSGASTAFSFGASLNGEAANCNGNYPYGTTVRGPYVGRTRTVGSYQPNNWGFSDMHGNVWEWCSDWYAPQLSGGYDPAGPLSGNERVVRGGSWDHGAMQCRAAYRSSRLPSDGNDFMGFRVAVVPTVRRAGDAKVVFLPDGNLLKLCWIPRGWFRMGSPESEAGRSPNEGPVDVEITQGFWMSSTQVTQAQWHALMRNNPSHHVGRRLPVENVTWDDALTFCGSLQRSVSPGTEWAGWSWRLPTEAEWEYACRAGTRTAFSFGPSLNGEDANCDGAAPYGTTHKGPVTGSTRGVCGYAPNAWGLYDMHGNVWEWCADWFSENLAGGLDPKGPRTGEQRVLRGGSWRDGASYCRSGFRFWAEPHGVGEYVGFRVVLVPPAGAGR